MEKYKMILSVSFKKVPDSIYENLDKTFLFIFSNYKTFLVLLFFLITDLQANTLDLEVRVGNLEENSGDNGNSSIPELELRVETLEDVTADQETRIVVAEENIQGEKR